MQPWDGAQRGGGISSLGYAQCGPEHPALALGLAWLGAGLGLETSMLPSQNPPAVPARCQVLGAEEQPGSVPPHQTLVTVCSSLVPSQRRSPQLKALQAFLPGTQRRRPPPALSSQALPGSWRAERVHGQQLGEPVSGGRGELAAVTPASRTLWSGADGTARATKDRPPRWVG